MYWRSRRSSPRLSAVSGAAEAPSRVDQVRVHADRRPLLQQLVRGTLGAELALERLGGLAAPLGVRTAGARLRGGPARLLGCVLGAGHRSASASAAARVPDSSQRPRRSAIPSPSEVAAHREAHHPVEQPARPARPGRRPPPPGRSRRRAAPAARPRTMPGARRADRRARGRCGSRARPVAAHLDRDHRPLHLLVGRQQKLHAQRLAGPEHVPRRTAGVAQLELDGWRRPHAAARAAAMRERSSLVPSMRW